MKKLSPKKAREARISRAIVGFVIPMMSIPAMYKALEAAIEADASEADLKAIVAAWPGVKESA